MQNQENKSYIRYLVKGIWTKKEPKDFSLVEAIEETKRITLEDFKKIEERLTK